MSTLTHPADPKILHSWTTTIEREVDETAPEVVNGQTLPVTRKVKRPLATRMALRALSRKEARAADLFLASRTAYYVKDHGLLLASELTNRLINTTGGVLTDKEKSRIEQLRAKHVELDMDLARGSTTLPANEKVRIGSELAAVRTELINLNAINEAVYGQTAEAKAQGDLNNWVTFHVILIDRSGSVTGAPRWQPYFEGDTFDKREEFAWALDEGKDEFYSAAVGKIATYVYWFVKGADTEESFKAMDDELAKQTAAREEAEKAAAAAQVVEPVAAITAETVV